jgi:hypothetical protein
MLNKRNGLAPVLTTLVLLLVLAVGPAVPGLAARVTEPLVGPAEMWPALPGPRLAPVDGGGSSGG